MAERVEPTAPRVDPVLLQLVRSGLTSVVDEMALAIMRTARSAGVREQMDFTTALCDRHGRVVAQGLGLAIHLGSFPDMIATVLARFQTFRPGDVVIVNDPWAGGTHLPDIYMLRPIFVRGSVFGYAVVNMHHMDVGGRTVGSIAPDSTEVFQEGLRIPPMLYRSEGTLDATFQLLLGANVRMPETVRGDLEAEENACLLAESRVRELVERYGADTLEAYEGHLIDYAERMARAEIAAMPDGEYSYVDFVDDDGLSGSPVRLQVNVVVAGDEITIDFTGSAPQVRGAINVAIPMTRSASFCCVRSIMRSNIPDNEGFCRPIHVNAPAGSVVNPRFPAAVGARGVTTHRVCDAIFGALAKAVPTRVKAAGEGGSTNIVIGGRRADGTAWADVEFMYGCWGGRPDRDGIDAASNTFSNMSNLPIELVESEVPIEITRYGFVPNSCGAGRYRGGLAMMREFRLLEGPATLTIRSDRQQHAPYGLDGGGAGATARNVLSPSDGSGPVPLPTLFTRPLATGDVFLHVQAGAGGHGDPLRRDPAAVARDVEDEKIDVAYALAEHGVVIDPETFAVDTRGTAARRAARKVPGSD